MDANQTTQMIVFGYVKHIELLFDTTNSPYCNIPLPISTILLSYVGNLFDTNGRYEWKIDNALLVNKILKAKCGDQFESKEFILCRLNCKLIIFPNGSKEEFKGSFVIHLYFELPSNIQQIIFVRVFRVKENMSGSAWISAISHDEYEYWSRKCPLCELIDINPSTITIEVTLNVQRLIVKNEIDKTLLKYCPVDKTRDIAMKSHLKLEFAGNAMKMLKNSKNGKSICSDIFDDMWRINIYPQGDSGRGYLDAYLTLCYLPRDVKQMVVRYELVCDAVVDDCVYINTFTVEDHSWGAETWIRFDVISKLNSITFTVDLKIKSILYAQECEREIAYPSKIAYILSSSKT